MLKRFILRSFIALLAFIGTGAIIFAILIGRPLIPPPPLQSILKGAQAMDSRDAPPLAYFAARDGTQLAYRAYDPTGGASSSPTAILIHGSAGNSLNNHLAGKALAAAGVRAIAVDMRGHGASGTRGDVSYIGQNEDDLADLLDHLKLDERPVLVGHSMGGGFTLRVAHTPLGQKFSRFVLLAPFLGIDASTSRPSSGGARWTSVDTPRIVALSILHRFGLECCESLPVLAFALPQEAQRYVTTRYSFRLLSSFGPKDMRYRDLSGIDAPIDIIAGANDELMIAERYEDIARSGAHARVQIIAGVDHMGVVREPAALQAIVAAVKADANEH